MITVPSGARALLATRPVDFRRGAHSLAALASEMLGADPFSGVVVVWRAKRADRIKILVWDASGLVLVWKQLQQGAFRWPPVMDGAVRLSAVECAALFDGLDWTRVRTVRRIPTPTAAGQKQQRCTRCLIPCPSCPRRPTRCGRCCWRHGPSGTALPPSVTGPWPSAMRWRRRTTGCGTCCSSSSACSSAPSPSACPRSRCSSAWRTSSKPSPRARPRRSEVIPR